MYTNLEFRTRGPCGATLAIGRTAQQIDLSGRAVVFESLKKRRRGVYRAVPVPPGHPRHGARHPGSAAARPGDDAALALEPHDRLPAGAGGHHSGRHPGRPPRLPQGAAARLRRAGGQPGHRAEHAAEVLGHAQLTTTAIYATAMGEEEQSIAARMW